MFAFDYMPSEDEPLIKSFYKMFGGSFGTLIGSDDEVFYFLDDKTYETPETKMDFFDYISKSIKDKNNLFLKKPVSFDDLTDDDII